MNNNNYKQFINNMKSQHLQVISKVKTLEAELHEYKTQVNNATHEKDALNIIIKELGENKIELDKKMAELESANTTINERVHEMANDLDKKNAELESANTKINEIANDLERKNAELESANAKIDELANDLHKKNAELESANAKIDEMENVLDKKNAELESANAKIDELVNDLDKKTDTFCQIDKIIFRNNEYFDELKKELSTKIKMNEEMNRLYEDASQKLHAATCELDYAYKELETTKADLQLFKNDFILKTARFDE